MLKQRVLTAMVLVLAVLAAVVLLPPLPFALVLGAVILLAAWEWTRLAGLLSPLARGLYLAAFAALLLLTRPLAGPALQVVLMAALLWWLLAFIFILLYPRHEALWGGRVFLSLGGILVLLPGWLSILFLRAQEHFVLLILLLIAAVAATDIGGYFAGRALGRRKLSPRVSPNKTWEGFWGGVTACALLVGAVVWLLAPGRAALGAWEWLELLCYGALLGMVSVVGDLLESMLKRHRGLKDSGRLLPGHGGILDRIDGITAAAPVYALLVMNIGDRLL